MSNPSSTALVADPAREPGIGLGLLQARSPREVVTVATEIARSLADVIEQRHLYVTLNGRRYVRCEGWTTLAAMLGVTPHEVDLVEADGVFVATVELRRVVDGGVVARASAECGAPDEITAKTGKPTWSTRPRYARRSMALTRATAKACRLAFSWILVLAKFEPTPAEEMPGIGESEGDPVPTPAPTGRPSTRRARASSPPPTDSPTPATALITDDQAKAFWLRARDEYHWSRDDLRVWLREAYGYTSIHDIPADRVAELSDAITRQASPDDDQAPF